MKNLLSTALFGVIFLGLAALAFLSAPRGASEVAASTAPETTSAVVSGSAPSALLATQNYNAISLPLIATASISPFDAGGLATYAGTPVIEVLRLNTNSQQFDSWDVAGGFGFVDGNLVFTPFSLETGHEYWLKVDNSDPTYDVFTIVGDVPAQGSINFTMVGVHSPCTYNSITVPLDQSAITNGAELGASIGNTAEILRLNADNQQFDSWDVTGGFGFIDGNLTFVASDFEVNIGYPYWACVAVAGHGTVWP